MNVLVVYFNKVEYKRTTLNGIAGVSGRSKKFFMKEEIFMKISLYEIFATIISLT